MITKREKREKEETINKEILAEFVNIALASSKIKKIQIEQEKGIFNLRTNINLFVYGGIGTSKSTLLNQIAKKTNSKAPYTDLTYPALVGSIDKMTRQMIVGSAWECRNSLLLLDEFDFGKRNKQDIRALLQLIEGGEYNRKLASFSAENKEVDGDLFYSFKNGEFNIKTRFSLLVMTMKYPYTSQNSELQALVTRCISIPFYPNKEEIKRIAKGHSIFSYVDKTPKELEIFVKRNDYYKIMNFVDERVKDKHNNYLRILGDCTRIFCVEGKHREDLYELVIKFQLKEFKSK